MPIYEKRYRRNGVPLPIQCIRMKRKAVHSAQELHYHDYTELLFGVSGCAMAYVGTECYPLTAGSMIIVHDQELHTVDGNGAESEYIVVKFLPSILFSEEQTLLEYTYARLLMQNVHDGKIFFEKGELEDTPIPELFYHMMEEWVGQVFAYELSLRADVMTVIMHIMRMWQQQNPDISDITVTAVQSELIQNAIEYIQAHFAELSEEECAHAMGVSASYFSRVFKKGMKTSFCSYLTQIKLKAAEKLLLSSENSMTDIAERVGFSTVSHFIASFRKRYRVSPAQYRRLLRGANEKASI